MCQQYGGSTVGVVNVTFIVPNGAESPAARSPKPAAAQTCTATQLVPAPSGPFSSFAAPAPWPTPIAVNLLDNCGAAVTNGLVTTTFSNGDPPLALSLTDSSTGLYSGTWTPGGSSSQVTTTTTAKATGFPAATALISGQVKPNAALRTRLVPLSRREMWCRSTERISPSTPVSLRFVCGRPSPEHPCSSAEFCRHCSTWVPRKSTPRFRLN